MDSFRIEFDGENAFSYFHVEGFEAEKTELLKLFSVGFSHFLHRRNLKPADVAKKFNLTHAAVSSWKNGKGFPDFITLFKLFAAGMTLKEMFGEDLGFLFAQNSLVDFPQIINNERKDREKFATMEDLDKMQKSIIGFLEKRFENLKAPV